MLQDGACTASHFCVFCPVCADSKVTEGYCQLTSTAAIAEHPGLPLSPSLGVQHGATGSKGAWGSLHECTTQHICAAVLFHRYEML